MLQCKDIYACKHEIAAYAAHDAGVPLLVGIDSYADYAAILGYAKLDSNRKIIALSDKCASEIPPNPQTQLSILNQSGDDDACLVLIGAAQAAMLRGRACLKDLLTSLAGLTVSRPVVVLCPFCASEIDALANRSPKLGHWTLTLHSADMRKPLIRVYPTAESCRAKAPVRGMKALLKILEDSDKLPAEIPFISQLDISLFGESLLQFAAAEKPYERLHKSDGEVAGHLICDNGSEQDWAWLDRQVARYGSFANVVNAELCATESLPYEFTDYISGDDEKAWLTYAALKVFCQKKNDYLTTALLKSKTREEFIRQLYFAILDERHSSPSFTAHMAERSRILDALDDDHSLMQDFCSHAAARYEADSIHYFRDATEEERNAIIIALAAYKYPERQLQAILAEVAPELGKYLHTYRFDQTNTKVMSGCEGIRPMLTDYFQRYKVQKLINHIDADFMQIVEEQAQRRDFMKLCARGSIVKSLDKAGARPYWIDALGVEYMGYIDAKCAEYGMICECEVARANLPSITCKNMEFEAAFPGVEISKEDELDKLKHHSKKYDYTVVREPLHIFDELNVLAKTLKTIASLLAHDKYGKAIILSDHGASRLAVIYESENEKLQLDAAAQHSGRCCHVDADPHIPCCIYEDGFAILANYERFKGGRKAAVEVHGGASLEEVLVPVLTLTAKPKNQKIFFPEDEITLRVNEVASIRLFAEPKLSKPKLVVNGVAYTGEHCDDPRNVRFEMSEIRRKGRYSAEVYDGGKKLAVLEFTVVKPTHSIDLFQ